MANNTEYDFASESKRHHHQRHIPLTILGMPNTRLNRLEPLHHMPGYDGPIPGLATEPQPSKTAAATYYHNSLVSPFLRLPLEIRRELYKAILGGRLVHFRLAMGQVSSKPWRHVVCQRGKESHFRAEQHRSLTEARLADDWEPSHRLCKYETYYNPNIEASCDYWDDERMHLAILRSCRQIYTEANSILWSTNTFSFHNHRCLKQFFLERNPIQKSLIKTLRLRFDLKEDSLTKRRLFLTPEWMQSLSGLRHLCLILEDEFPTRLVHTIAITGKSLTEVGGNRIDAGLTNLSLLPVRTVEVEVLSPTSLTDENDALKEAWKKEYAESVRDYILGRRREMTDLY